MPPNCRMVHPKRRRATSHVDPAGPDPAGPARKPAALAIGRNPSMANRIRPSLSWRIRSRSKRFSRLRNPLRRAVTLMTEPMMPPMMGRFRLMRLPSEPSMGRRLMPHRRTTPKLVVHSMPPTKRLLRWRMGKSVLPSLRLGTPDRLASVASFRVLNGPRRCTGRPPNSSSSMLCAMRASTGSASSICPSLCAARSSRLRFATTGSLKCGSTSLL